jgi:chloride channel protein, CIC family
MAVVMPAQNQYERKWRSYPQLRWISQFLDREERVFLLLSLVIGALTGLAVVAFILVTERLGTKLFPAGYAAAWRRLFMPIGGSLAMGYLLYRYFPNARGSGVPQTKAALFAHNGFISLRTVLGKFFCTATTLASGIPLGREGPSVQVGAGIGSVLGRWLGLSPEKVKALIPVGAAAAVAAAFNTPLAAVMFALEEIMGDLHAPVLGSVVIASATAWGVLHLTLGNDPLFHVPEYSLHSSWEFLIYALLGVAGGFLSVAFTQTLVHLRKFFLSLPAKTRWWHPVVGGVLVGCMGWFLPQVLGVGYTYVGQALNGTLALKVMLLLIVLKMVSVTVSYASGNAGGIFGPALLLGSMLGGVIGTIAHHYLPAYTATSGAYALVGMGALFAGIIRAPMTSVLMIFEMTHDYAVIVPLMIANMTSLFIASRLQHEPIYELLAHQDGIHLPSPSERHELTQRTVLQVMQREPVTLSLNHAVSTALEQIASNLLPGDVRTGQRIWPVIDKDRFLGIVDRESLQTAFEEGGADRPLLNLVKTVNVPHVYTDQPLYLALERMSKFHLDLIPVVHRAEAGKLLGVVTMKDLMDAYGLDGQERD